MKTVFEGQRVHEEIANSITHGMGAVLALAATSLLTVFSALEGSAIKVVSFSIFGFTLFLLYLVSCLYHGFQNPRIKRVFHILDHSAIFILIAGTYTPVSLVALGGAWGWTLFGVIWSLAVIGVTVTATLFERARYFSVILYVAMGWLVVAALPRLWGNLSIEGTAWMISGGILYTVGIWFYRAKHLRYHHMIWHLFVLGGSLCHFFMMLGM